MSSIGNTFAYGLHLLGWICASQIVMKICRKVFTLLDAVSLTTFLKSPSLIFPISPVLSLHPPFFPTHSCHPQNILSLPFLPLYPKYRSPEGPYCKLWIYHALCIVRILKWCVFVHLWSMPINLDQPLSHISVSSVALVPKGLHSYCTCPCWPTIFLPLLIPGLKIILWLTARTPGVNHRKYIPVDLCKLCVMHYINTNDNMTPRDLFKEYNLEVRAELL